MNGSGETIRAGNLGGGTIGCLLLCGALDELPVHLADGFPNGTQGDHDQVNRRAEQC